MSTKVGKILEGTVKRHPDGFGFLIPDDIKHPDVYIPASKMGSALTNDRVKVLVHKKPRRGLKSYFGFIHAIVKRDKGFAVGPFEMIDKQAVLKEHNLSYKKNILVSNPNKIPVEEQEWVKVKINFYPKGDSLFKGELVENLGKIGSTAKDDIKRIMAEYEIPSAFPNEVLQELKKIPNEVTDQNFVDRKDLRQKPFVTIDGATAQDFDDAIYVEKLPDLYRLYVAIADVSHYVQEGSLLDKEAFERSNSSYFPNFCSPMLPEKLSNDLCSLKAEEPRLVMVQEMDFNFQGEKIKSEIYPSVIQSQKRLTYGQAQDILDDLSSLKGDYLDSLKSSEELAKLLLKNHIKNQALNLDIPETLVIVDEQGETQDILKEQRLFSHQMIEQFMLEANKSTSAFLEHKKIPLMYRIHEVPDTAKLKNLQKFSNILGFSSSFESRENLIQFLSEYTNHKQTFLINKLVLRSLSQARYSAHNKGHYGLNFVSYTHFTSPIRRYCDLVIHRLIKQALSQKESFQKQKKTSHKKISKINKRKVFSEKELEKQARFISGKEQNSVKAERQIKDIKKARFLKQYVGENFDGNISSISSFGLFITLKKFDAEGLVRFKDMKGFWDPDEFQLNVRNKAGYTIKFGDEVKILILSSQVLTGRVEFKLLSHKDTLFNK